MYFLSEEEKRYLLRKLLPEARAQRVADDLRGWNWHQPPLSPVYEARLGVSEIAGRYCPTARDVYLRRVEQLQRPANPDMIEGATFHELLHGLVLATKRAIYDDPARCIERLREMHPPVLSAAHPTQAWDAGARSTLEHRRTLLWRFELTRIIAKIEDVMARQPYVGADSLAALALPVVVESKVDGRFLGLSPHLSADAFVFAQPMVLDVKFGEPREFHRWGTTGYALALESVYESPIDVGCIAYVQFRGDRILIERDFHLISDELRQRFIDERDAVSRLVEEEIDPGVAAVCPANCPFFTHCHPESTIVDLAPRIRRRAAGSARHGESTDLDPELAFD